MTHQLIPTRRDLFEIENARHLTRDEVTATFVPTREFWRLLSPKNHIVLGARGSGKTVLAKMLSHDHLARYKSAKTEAMIAGKEFVGVFVPIKLEWVGGLRAKPWDTEPEAEVFFQWKTNLASFAAFLDTVKSCLQSYVADVPDRLRSEEHLSLALSDAWLDDEQECNSIQRLRGKLEDLEYDRHMQILRLRAMNRSPTSEPAVGLRFSADLFLPLRRGIQIIERALGFPASTTWILCLDEAEYLESFHHRILNTCLRAYSERLVFKITTMPYFHHTMETNVGVPLNEGHDFEYVYIDQDPIRSDRSQEEGISSFAVELFSKRAAVSGVKYRGLSLGRFLGPSALLDEKRASWEPGSANYQLLMEYANERTKTRALELGLGSAKFMDQIGRKMQPALLLRGAVEETRGAAALDVYSGAALAVRCGDENPRRLIRIMNSLLQGAQHDRRRARNRQGLKSLSEADQTRILRGFSANVLNTVQAEPRYGRELHTLVTCIGEYMKDHLHNRLLGTDYVSSVRLDLNVPDSVWSVIQLAVGLGMLFPNINTNNPDQMPDRRGTFHLAYVLAPHFLLLPRRGRAHSLSKVVSTSVDWGSGAQLSLFTNGDGSEQ